MSEENVSGKVLDGDWLDEKGTERYEITNHATYRKKIPRMNNCGTAG